MGRSANLNITDCIDVFLRSNTWRNRKPNQIFYDLFRTWFTGQNKSDQELYKAAAHRSDKHDFQQVCSKLFVELHRKRDELPLVFQQLVECLSHLLEVPSAAQIQQEDNILSQAMREYLTQGDMPFWVDTPGVYGVFPPRSGKPSAQNVQKVTATVVPLDAKAAGKVIAANFKPDLDGQKALQSAYDVVTNSLQLKSSWMFGECLWWMVPKTLVSWSKTRLLKRHAYRWSWGAVLKHSVIYIHRDNGGMREVQGPSLALPSALAILLALPSVKSMSQDEEFPPLPYQCKHLSVNNISYAYTGTFELKNGDLGKVGNIQEKREALTHFNNENENRQPIKILICPEQNFLDNNATLHRENTTSVPCKGFKSLQDILNHLIPMRVRLLWIWPCNITFMVVFFHILVSLGLSLWDQCFSKPTPRFDTYQCANCWAGVDENPGVVSLKADREGSLQLHISETTVQRYHRQNLSDYLIPYYLLSRKDAPLTVTIIVEHGSLTSLLPQYVYHRFKEFNIRIESNGWVNFIYIFTDQYSHDNGYIFINNRKGEKLKQYFLYIKRAK